MTLSYKTLAHTARDAYGIDMGDPRALKDYDLFGERHTHFGLIVAHALCALYATITRKIKH